MGRFFHSVGRSSITSGLPVDSRVRDPSQRTLQSQQWIQPACCSDALDTHQPLYMADLRRQLPRDAVCRARRSGRRLMVMMLTRFCVCNRTLEQGSFFYLIIFPILHAGNNRDDWVRALPGALRGVVLPL